MSQEEYLEAIIKEINGRLLDVNEETYDEMARTVEDLKQWQKAGGNGKLPFYERLIAWQINVPAELLVTTGEADDPRPDDPRPVDEHPEALDADYHEEADSSTGALGRDGVGSNGNDSHEHKDEATTADLPTDGEAGGGAVDEQDRDDLWEEDFEEAVALLTNERYFAAREQFDYLRQHAPGRHVNRAERLFEEARAKLADQVRPLIQQAELVKDTAPNDFDAQSRLWEEVLEVDRTNEQATGALHALRQRRQERYAVERAKQLDEDTTEAVAGRDLAQLNRLLGDVITLQESNEIEALQPELDALRGRVEGARHKLREQLGAASTLSVSGNLREAYRRIREELDLNTKLIVDAQGILGEADAEVEPYPLYQEIRRRFLASLQNLAQQRRELAEGQQREKPELALETLQDAVRLLTDEVFTVDDRHELQPTLEPIERAIQEVTKRIERYREAQERVLAANGAGAEPEEQVRLFKEARELYSDYPRIDEYIESAQDAQAAKVAGRILDQITLAERRLAADDFQGALEVLKMARQEALNKVPEAKPDSDLKRRLDEIRQLEQRIITGESDYNHMMSALDDVDELISRFEAEKAPDLLATARNRLEQLSSIEANHPETRRRRARLIELQGVDESWKQGEAAYRLGEWERAMELLQRVAESESASERIQALIYIQRAQAARYVQEAAEAENNRDWRTALDRYFEAARLFDEYGSDSQTDYLHSESRSALERLKPLEENDQEVRRAIQQAQAWLREADSNVRGRNSVLDRVEPVAQYPRAVQMLTELRDKDTTLTSELMQTLREAREAWRRTYLEGMQQARRSSDIGILRRAFDLGLALETQGLLYEPADKQVFQAVREQFLELQYAVLQQDPGADPKLLEENRRQRLEMAAVKTEDLRTQYRQAMEMRVKAQMSEKRRKSIAASFDFLRGELERPELYQSELLFREFMHLAWETGAWTEAQGQADSLAYRARIQNGEGRSRLWRGLTEAASLLDSGDVANFQAEIQRQRTFAQEDPQLMGLLEEEQKWLIEWRVGRLVELARSEALQEGEIHLIKAAQLYAQASHLKPGDIRINTGLREVGLKIGSSLHDYAELARNVRIHRSLDESIRTAAELEEMLDALLQVHGALSMQRDTIANLEDGLETLRNRLKPWQQIKTQLDQIDREVNEVLAFPEPLRPDGSGGWSFEEILQKLSGTMTIARSDRQIGQLLVAKREQLQLLDDKARALNDKVKILANAIQDEEFDVVIESANELDTLWSSYVVDGFQGLSDLISHHYPFLKREIRRLPDHRQQAQQQLTNWQEWQGWANSVEEKYQAVRSSALRIQHPLDDLRQDKALSEIATIGREIISVCDDFEDALALEPELPPMSRRARKEQEKATEVWKTEVFEGRASYREKAKRLLESIEKDSQEFKNPLRRLKAAMRQLEASLEEYERRRGSRLRRSMPLPRGRFSVVRACFYDCDALDPLHFEVSELRRRFKDIERRYPEADQ